jgi:hypothetical protein
MRRFLGVGLEAAGAFFGVAVAAITAEIGVMSEELI